MSRTLVIVLAAFSFVLLGGAWLASRALTADVTVPPGPVVVLPPAVPTAPLAPPVPVVPVRRPDPNISPLAQGAAPAVRDPPRPGVPTPPPVVADSMYAEENSAELDSAWALVDGPKASPATWRRAAKVFRRCLAQVPTNRRCQLGLETATTKLGTPAPAVAAPTPGAGRVRSRHDPEDDDE